MNNEINRVKTGDLNISVHSDYSDEIGNLTNNFDNMIRHINRLIEDIRESEQIQKKAELKALQAQIKPHFLYNVLQAVNWNAIDKGDTETSLIVVNLSNFYRAVLNKGDDDISVEKELKIVEYYINVEKAIYGDIFKVAYNIDEGIKNCLAIPLILQPLVENAIEHGIRNLAEPHGEIVVSARNTGCGSHPPAALPFLQSHCRLFRLPRKFPRRRYSRKGVGCNATGGNIVTTAALIWKKADIFADRATPERGLLLFKKT